MSTKFGIDSWLCDFHDVFCAPVSRFKTIKYIIQLIKFLRSIKDVTGTAQNHFISLSMKWHQKRDCNKKLASSWNMNLCKYEAIFIFYDLLHNINYIWLKTIDKFIYDLFSLFNYLFIPMNEESILMSDLANDKKTSKSWTEAGNSIFSILITACNKIHHFHPFDCKLKQHVIYDVCMVSGFIAVLKMSSMCNVNVLSVMSSLL